MPATPVPEGLLRQLQRTAGNSAVQRSLTSAQRAGTPTAVQRQGEDEAPETWGAWAKRHRWKIAGAAVLTAVAAGGLYLYLKHGGGGTSTAAGENASEAAANAGRGLAGASAPEVTAAVEQASHEGPGFLTKLMQQTTRATENEIVDVLAGNSLPSMSRETATALRMGLPVDEAMDRVITDPTHIGFG